MGTISANTISGVKPASGSNYVNIAQSLIDQMKTAGQPRVSTTNVTYPEEPMNYMNLGLIAMMLLEQYLNKDKVAPSAMNNPAALNPITGIQGLQSTPSQQLSSGGYGSMNPAQLLQAILGASRRGW